MWWVILYLLMWVLKWEFYNIVGDYLKRFFKLRIWNEMVGGWFLVDFLKGF